MLCLRLSLNLQLESKEPRAEGCLFQWERGAGGPSVPGRPPRGLCAPSEAPELLTPLCRIPRGPSPAVPSPATGPGSLLLGVSGLGGDPGTWQPGL